MVHGADGTDSMEGRLSALKDDGYAAFLAKLLPTLEGKKIVGVRTPALRSLAKSLVRSGEAEAFLSRLPHSSFDEDQLHAFIISLEGDFSRCMEKVEAFLPFIDNWATCDQLSPAAFKRNAPRLLPFIEGSIRSPRTYTVRFSIKLLMQHFLDGLFQPRYASLVASVRPGEYYVDMMAAWYFATALAKQYEAVVPFMERRILPPWTHNKAIQKSLESRRIPRERKDFLRSLKGPARK